VRILILFSALAMSLSGYTQELIPIGSWRTHFNYKRTLLVEQVNDRIFAATDQALIFYDPEDNSLNTITKLDGLSDVGISALAYDEQNNRLVVGYENGNLDIISSDHISNNTLLLESNVTESKSVHHISFYEGEINLATDFGVLIMDPITEQAVGSYRNLGPNGGVTAVNQITFLEDMMYMATDSGAMVGDRSLGLNLQDFNNWERLTGSPIGAARVSGITTFNGSIYTSYGDTLLKLSGSEWLEINVFDNEISRLHSSEDVLMIITDNEIYEMNAAELVEVVASDPDDSPRDALKVDNAYWYTDASNGLTRLANGEVNRFVLDGPSENIFKLEMIGQKLAAISAFEVDDLGTTSNQTGYSVFDGGIWSQITSESLAGLTNVSGVTEVDNQVWVSSFGSGLFDQATLTIYDESNSFLQEHDPDEGNILVTDVATDSESNIWVSNLSSYPLQQYDTNGEWSKFAFGSIESQSPATLFINPTGGIWMSLGLNIGAGILGYDPGSGLHRLLDTENSSLPSNRVYDIAFDLENEIWIATGNGVAYFPFAFDAIGDESIDVVQPVFENAVLFRGKAVHCIEVDAGNRKWMGTSEGAWLFEDNADELVYHFNIDNSPLPSNEIRDVAINDITGEVFFATDEGVVSFRGDAVSGSTSHQNVKIFPNPVSPQYAGNVGISGLARDANVKITTVSGRLVREINAAGSGASWDISDYNGRRVNGGVYLVFSSDEQGQETFVGKIAVID
jgi:hypothetical protein